MQGEKGLEAKVKQSQKKNLKFHRRRRRLFKGCEYYQCSIKSG